MRFILLIIASASLSVSAQTNTVKVFTTNYVTAAANFRDVDGTLYDITKSTNWTFIRCKYQDQEGDLAVLRKIECVKIGERPAVNSHSMESAGLGNLSGPAFIPDRNIYADQDGGFILVKNLPIMHLVTGQELQPRLLRVGEQRYNGSIVAIYDCGTPHIVPVITSKLVKTP